MSEQVVLMDRGNSLSTGTAFGGDSGTRIYWSQSARPELSGTPLPELGDTWSGNTSGEGSNLILTTINKVPILEDHTIGYEYQCNYIQNVKSFDPLGTAYTNIPSINCSAEFDTYTFPTSAEDPNANTIWYTVSGETNPSLSEPVSISKTRDIINISTTTRDRGTFVSILAKCVAYSGKINSNVWNGISVGNVLCTGLSVQPIEEIVTGAKKITYDVTYNFAIKYSGNTDNNWQRIFYKGQYVRLFDNFNGSVYSNPIYLYEYANLPETLT